MYEIYPPPRSPRFKYIIGALCLAVFLIAGIYVATHLDQFLALLSGIWSNFTLWWTTTAWDTMKYTLIGLGALTVIILLVADI